MRIPGSRPVARRLGRAFELTDEDRRALKRGWGTTKAVTGGVVADAAAGGHLITSPRTLVTVYVVPAVATALSKGRREYQRRPNGATPPEEEK